MALASLTVDLTMNLARFEGDSGRAAQIVTRDSEKMSRAAASVERSLQKQADQVGRTASEYGALQAAEAGLTETTNRFLNVLSRSEEVASQAAKGSANAFTATSAAAIAASTQQRDINRELVTSILAVNEAYRQQRGIVLAKQSTGLVGDSQTKIDLAALDRIKLASIQQLKTKAAEEQAAQDVAIAEAETLARRTAVFQKFQDTVAKKVLETEAAEKASLERRAADTQRLVDQQNGLTATYRSQLAALEDLRAKGSSKGGLTPAQFDTERQNLFSRQPSVIAAQKAAADEVKAQEAVLVVEERRQAAGQKLTDVHNGLTATYRAEIKELVALRDAGAISPATFTSSKADIVSRLPAVKARAEALEATQKEEQAVQSLIDRLNKLGPVAEKNVAALKNTLATATAAAAAAAVPTAYGGKARSTGASADTQQLRDQAEAAKKTALEFVEAEERKRAALLKTAEAFQQNVIATARAAQIKPEDRRATLLAEQAAVLNLTKQMAPFIEQIRQADNNMNKFGRQTGLNIVQLQTLKYTVSDVIASAASGISPFTILLQQGGQVAQIEGGIQGIFKGALSYITPFRVGVGLLSAALGVLVVGLYEGSERGKQFANALVLSGNYAGQTAQSFNDMAKSIAASGEISIAGAREFGSALISTGQIGPAVLAKATDAAARYGAATGKNAKEVAADFASMGEDVVKWASEHNKSLNFVTPAQLLHIKTLQEQGKAVEAQSLVYELLDRRLKGTEANLGSLDRYLRTTTGTWKNFWDWVYDVGRPETIESKIANTQTKIARLVEAAKNPGLTGPKFVPQLAAAREELAEQLGTKLHRDTAAAASAESGELNKAVEAADRWTEAQLRGAKASAGLNREIANMQLQFGKQDKKAARDPDYAAESIDLRSVATRAAIEKQIRERYTDKPAASQADQTRKSLLAADLAFLKNKLQEEQDALSFNQQFLQGQYQAGNVSLKEFYDQKRANIATGVQKELNLLTDEQARLEVELEKGKFKDPHERIDTQKQLDDVIAKSSKLEIDAGRKVRLANQEEERSFVDLTNRLLDYQANLAQLAGDEFAAAQARNKVTINNARLFAKQSGLPQEDVDRQERALEIQTEFAEVQRRVGLLSANGARAEEIFAIRAEREGLSLRDGEQQLYTIRAAQLVQLGELADKARQLAAANATPENIKAAADLALAYAKAADAVDPAINRLREANRELASELSAGLTQSLTNFSDYYSARAQKAAQDQAQQKDGLNKQIYELEAYLAKTHDANDKARLREQIKALQSQRDTTKESGNLLLKTVERDILAPLAKSVLATINKVFIQQPLEAAVKGVLNKITGKVFGGENPAGDSRAKEAAAIETHTTVLGNATLAMEALVRATEAAAIAVESGRPLKVDAEGFGLDADSKGYSPAKDSQKASEALDQLTAATGAQTSSTNVANAAFELASKNITAFSGCTAFASQALRLIQATGASSSGTSVVGGVVDWVGKIFGSRGGSTPLVVDKNGLGVDASAHGYSPAKDSQKADEDLLRSQSELTAATALQTSAASDATAQAEQSADALGGFSTAARYASAAMQLFQSITSASTASSGASGLAGWFGKLFGGGGAPSDAVYGTGAAGFAHTGGIAGALTTSKVVSLGVFEGAQKFHTGGIVSQRGQIASLAHDEVPAILRRREEVLREDDPRHRDNLPSEHRQGIAAAERVNRVYQPTVSPRAVAAIPVLHIGGIVSAARDSRSVPTVVFQSAPRYHTGGIVGLAPDDVPLILRTGSPTAEKSPYATTSHVWNSPSHVVNTTYAPTAANSTYAPISVVNAPTSSSSHVNSPTSTSHGNSPTTNSINHVNSSLTNSTSQVNAPTNSTSNVVNNAGSTSRVVNATSSTRYANSPTTNTSHVANLPTTSHVVNSPTTRSSTSSVVNSPSSSTSHIVNSPTRSSTSYAPTTASTRYVTNSAIHHHAGAVRLAPNEVPTLRVISIATEKDHGKIASPEIVVLAAPHAISIAEKGGKTSFSAFAAPQIVLPALRAISIAERSHEKMASPQIVVPAAWASASTSKITDPSASRQLAAEKTPGLVFAQTSPSTSSHVVNTTTIFSGSVHDFARSVPNTSGHASTPATSAGRVLSTAAFHGATRYHGGGMVGMAPDEVPSVLRRGEEVLRRDDPRHRYNTARAERNSGFQYAPTFNVPPNTDHRTLAQIGQAAYEGAQRAYQRNS